MITRIFLVALPLIGGTAISYAQYSIAPRHLEKIVCDLHKKELIVFGGAEFLEGKVSFPSSVSIWDGRIWTVVDPEGPGTRVGNSLIYDEDDQSIYLISGIRNDADGEHTMLDVWRLKDNRWTKVAGDAPVKTSDGAYDVFNKRLLIFGDVHDKTKAWNGGDPQKFELWEFKNYAWRKLSVDGPQIDGAVEVAFDKQRGVLVIPSWEPGKSFVWEWKDGTWNKLEATGAPEARNRFALAYDHVTNATYLFGGRNSHTEYFSDFWKWDGSQWEELVIADSPTGRAGATMEAGFGGLVLYGGVGEKGPVNEIWIWKNGVWKKH
jgi:hypothetical protein